MNELGRGDNSSKHDGDGGDFDEAHEVCEAFVVVGCDTRELFDFVEKAFDDVARLVVGMLMFSITPWRDDRLGACL